jgi:hypothetical protein
MPFYIYNNELYHHGVKGMKWGVRRDKARKARREAGNVARLEKDRAKAQNKLDNAKNDRARRKAQKDVDRLAKADAQVYGELKRNQAKKAVKLAAFAGVKAYGYAKSPRGQAQIKRGKAAMQKLSDSMFDYSILDANGKVLRRFN